MRIAVYANELIKDGDFGVKIYSREIIKHLLQLQQNQQYLLFATKKTEDFQQAEQMGKVTWSLSSSRFAWFFTAFVKNLKDSKVKLLFLPIQTFPFLFKNKIKVVTVVHDVAFLLFPQHFTAWRRLWLRIHTYRSVKLSDAIIVPSIATKNDIIKFYHINPAKIFVIPHGCSLSSRVSVVNKQIQLTQQNTVAGYPYILFVGAINPRKNLSRLISAFEIIRHKGVELKLVIVGGRGWLSEEVEVQARNSQFTADIILTGNVSEDCLVEWYRGALFFVFPSLYEGFGLPLVEAMNFALPIVCANNSAVSEVVGDMAITFDEYNVSDMAEKILTVFQDKDLRQDLAQKSLSRASFFSWQKAAQQTSDVLQQVAEQ